jgi:acetyltransferase-like isoleucine patch superfamily enzyme
MVKILLMVNQNVMNYIAMIKRFYRKYFWSNEKYARFMGVKIGKKCSIGTRNFGSEPYLIEIGNNTQITDGVSFYTHSGAWVFLGRNIRILISSKK